MSSSPTAPLKITRQTMSDSPIVIEISGDLVTTNQDTLRGEVEDLLDRGVSEIVLAVDEITHIDTSGFSLLVQLGARCVETGGWLTVAGLPGPFEEVAETLRIKEVVRLAPTVEAAIDRSGR